MYYGICIFIILSNDSKGESMKKFTIFILSLLLILITGCSNNNLNTEYFIDYENEFSDCGDSCSQDQSEFASAYYDYIGVYESLISSLLVDPVQEVENISVGNTYSRSVFKGYDLYTGNDKIQLRYPYYYFSLILNEMKKVVSNCDLDQECSPIYVYTTVSDVDYGFNHEGGYFVYTLNDNSKYLRRFNIAEGNLEYEAFQYNPELDSIIYVTLKNDVFKQYMKSSDSDNYSLYYINLETKDIVQAGAYNGKEFINVFDAKNETFYEKTNSYDYGMYIYDDMIFVTSIEFYGDKYTHQISFKYMAGWDEIYRDDHEIIIYNDGNEAFEKYNTFIYKMNDYYLDLLANDMMTKSEFSNYEFPAELQISLTKSEFEEELNKLKDDNFIYEKVGLTYRGIVNFLNDLKEQIKEELTD